MFDINKPFARCYGRSDGAIYLQKGCYYKPDGTLASDENRKQAHQDAAAKELSMAYTREALEEISESQGMAGLRSIAEPFGVKGSSKKELIAEILEAQGKQ